MSESASQRAARRRREAQQWPIRKYALGQEPARDPLDPTTAEQRVAMMWPLALQMWTLAGKAVPQYTRATMPGRIIRPDKDEP